MIFVFSGHARPMLPVPVGKSGGHNRYLGRQSALQGKGVKPIGSANQLLTQFTIDSGLRVRMEIKNSYRHYGLWLCAARFVPITQRSIRY
jgi:hypothetical protein